MPHSCAPFWLCTLVVLASGCQLMQTASAPPNNAPLYVATTNQDYLWERTVDVLHEYPFEVERESRLDGIIETRYKIGSGIQEPWHRESIGLENRLESTFQSVRRKVVVHITPVDGGYTIAVEAYKELEDVVGLAANSAGGATFQDHTPLQRDLNAVVGQTAPSGWILQGRDVLLERDIQRRLQRIFAK
ncbi:hypothetical protein [Thalassoroseus pseudoceratinae]|uniref:hypothetical protein n=1 Tax=Thalassoroseus pseudoceratinae TaxID=2713176 RepID=UPI001F0E4B40|nr:hypothetical protein [Thalassoroseus pseudoceratinae]